MGLSPAIAAVIRKMLLSGIIFHPKWEIHGLFTPVAALVVEHTTIQED